MHLLPHLVAVVSLMSLVAGGCAPEPARNAEPASAEAKDESGATAVPAVPASAEAGAATKPAEAVPGAATGGDVELTIAGDLEARLEGAGVACSQIVHDGTSITTVKVDSRSLGAEGDWNLALVASSEEEWDAPAVVLNVRGAERASYSYDKTIPSGESASVKRDLSGADLDLTLKEIAGKGRIKVTGTLRCPTR